MDALDRYEPPRAWWDPLVTIGVGAAVYGLLALWSYPILHPSVWNEVAIAAGRHVPEHPFPGVYRALVQGLFHGFTPVQLLDVALTVLGRMAIAGASMCVYLGFRELLPALLLERMHLARVGMRMGRFCAVFVALLFACSDPVWRAGQAFSPTSWFLLLATGSVWCLSRFGRRGETGPLYAGVALLGILSSESVLGILLTLLSAAVGASSLRRAGQPSTLATNPMMDELTRTVVRRRLVCVWAGVFVIGLGFNGWWFVASKGLEASGSIGVPGLVFEYVRGLWHAVRNAASPAGWMLVFIFGVAPLVFTHAVLAKAWDEDRILPWRVGVAYVGMGLMALMPLSAAGRCWFWTWLKGRMLVESDALLAVVLALDVATVATGIIVLGVDAYCRSYWRLARQLFPDPTALWSKRPVDEQIRRTQACRRKLFWLAVLLVPVCVVPGRRLETERAMLDAMRCYAEEFERETSDCEVAFTDGAFDCLHELERFRRGGPPLRCLPMVAYGDPRARTRARVLRQRAAAGEEDLRLLEGDATTALRAWVAAGSPQLKACAVQMGFELWRRDRFTMPDLLAVVARPGGAPSAARARARIAAEQLCDPISTLALSGSPAKSRDLAVRWLFACLMNRLARLAQMRSMVADQEGRREAMIREAALADGLDEFNEMKDELRLRFNWLNAQASSVLSPRENLMLGLTRGDYALAGKNAALVLKSNPDDVYANFAMGMRRFREGQWALAAEHLERCRRRRPDDVAVLNNLALVQLRLGQRTDAERSIRAALRQNPDLPELNQTLQQVLKGKQ